MAKLKPYHVYHVDSEPGKIHTSTRAIYYKDQLYMVSLYPYLSRNPNPSIELTPLRDDCKEGATLVKESEMSNLEKSLINALKKGSKKIKATLDITI